jgi:hypothetical protein
MKLIKELIKLFEFDEDEDYSEIEMFYSEEDLYNL